MNADKRKSRRKASAFTLIVAFVCVALMGLALIPLQTVKLNPAHVMPGFTVSFSLPGASAQVLEKTVTSKLEAMLVRIKGVMNISSVSGNGTGNITVDLDMHTDIDMARFEASTIIRQTWPELPDGVSYPSIRMRSPGDNAFRPCMTFTLNASSTPIQIQRYAEEHIQNRLARLPGIYQINISGATPMEWRLEYDSEQLRQLGISTNDISLAVNAFFQQEFLGVAQMESSSGGRKWIRVALIPQGNNQMKFDASQIAVCMKEGKIITLDKLVKVSYAEENPTSFYRINGQNSIYLSIVAEESANQLEVSDAVKETMEKIREELPYGYEIHTSYDSTDYIRKELNTIYMRTGLTVVILLLFVLLITLSPKYLWLIVVSLSLNMAIAFIFYYLFDVEIQLYSLAGITISLNLVIDNTIVMTDHYLRQKNLKAFLSILAATLTTMGALVIIFFLDEETRLNLQDFAMVVIINLAISLFVALFFVPSMIEKIGLKEKGKAFKTDGFVQRKLGHKLRRFPVRFTGFYQRFICFLSRWRVAVYLVLLLSFGLPVFLMPDWIQKDTVFAEWYNKIFASELYREKLRPVVDKVLGGSWRLFSQKVPSGSYNEQEREVSLYVTASLPNGSTLEQMNTLIRKMEVYLSRFSEISQFQTNIYGAQQAAINVFFKKEHQKSDFPYLLKSNIISKALQLGGGSWGVYGLEDRGFSNDVRENAGSYQIKIYGYNYDDLWHYAEELKKKMLTHRRIKDVIIASNFSYWKSDYQEFYFDLNKERTAQQNVSVSSLFATISPMFGQNRMIGQIHTNEGTEWIKLSSRQARQYDVWAMQNSPYESDARQYKLSELADIAKGQSPQNIVKENQQYRLCLQYEYIGTFSQGGEMLNKDIEEFNKQLPVGYKAENIRNTWSFGDGGLGEQFRLLLIIAGIIFFITGILFNSLKQPLAIMLVIPVSYIGVFLTFYWFGLKFDQGGFAAFVLLCGITVNASIYILNEYNSIRRRLPGLSPLRAYVKAWNIKVIPIFLTVVSTILGFIPFMVGEEREAFWFPLAAGTIGGLVMSLVGVFIFLPLLALKKKEARLNS